jgi:SAM-dependent methyltransferase
VDRAKDELRFFSQPTDVHALPPIAHYWSEKYLTPMLRQFGVSNAHECIRSYLAELCRSSRPNRCTFLSVGSGNGEAEICMAQWLTEQNLGNFSFECLDMNGELLEQGKRRALDSGVASHFSFRPCDINHWTPSRKYDAIVALQSLHHVLELENLLDQIREALSDDGYFLSDDMIGRNGHQRWPEALILIQRLWQELPDTHKYNHQLARLERRFQNWDCSVAGFEGIRSQDILRLLVERFHFQLFFVFGNLIDVFIDRGFGHNFDPERQWDREFIDRVHAVDTWHLERGLITPTHMIAAMKKFPVEHRLIHKHFTPGFSLRKSGLWLESDALGSRHLLPDQGSIAKPVQPLYTKP